MAETPTFSDSNEEVANLVGLKNLKSGGSSQEVFVEALRSAKTSLWLELGSTLITEINGTTFNASPSTDAEFVRLIARQVEIDITRWYLMDVMQLGFKGGEPEFLEKWNTDGKFKRLSTGQLQDTRAKLWESIAKRVEVLKGNIQPGDGNKAKAFLIDAESAGYHRVALHRYSPYTGDVLLELLKDD